jgi:hypothetical protein
MTVHELKPKEDKELVTIHDDLKRLVKSMQTVLERRYPVTEERKLVAGQIMAEVQKAA